MKKTNAIKSIAAAALSLMAAGCAKEQLADNAQQAGVSFSVEVPGAPATKAIGDGTTAKTLYYQVFDNNGEPISRLGAQTTTFGADGKAKVNFQLVKDQTYSFIFWAQTSESGYYTVGGTEAEKDLRTITANYDGKKSNDENFDAFFAVITGKTITGPVSETVTLKRPFAQVNIASNDRISAGGPAQPIDFTGATSMIAIKGIPTTFSPLTGALAGAGESYVEFAEASAPLNEVKVNEVTYTNLAMNYVFAPADGAVCDIKATLTVGGKEVALEVPNAPIKRNWRTNIVGNILTSEAGFDVVIDPNFDGDDDQHPVFVNGVAYKTLDAAVAAVPAGEQTIIKLENDIAGNGVKTTDGQDIVIDLGGHTFDIDGTMVGSTGSETNGHQFLKGSKVTLKNGTIKSTKAYILIQNYCDLTLEDVTLDASESVGAKEGSYVISNNHGTVKILGSTSILAPAGKVAFDVYYWTPAYKDGVNVYVNTTGTISGAIEYGCSSGSETASETLSSLVIDNAVLENSSFKTTLARPNVKVAAAVFADADAVNAWIPSGYWAVKSGDYYHVTKNSAPVSVSVSGQDELDNIIANIPAGETAEITLSEGTYKLPTLSNGMTITGETGNEVIDCAEATTVSAADVTISNVTVKGNGTFTNGSSLEMNGVNSTVKGCVFTNGRQNTYGRNLAVSNKEGSVATVSDCDFRKSGCRGIQIWNTGDEVKIDNCLFDNLYPFNCDSGTGKITVTDSELRGWTSYTSSLELVSFTNCKFGKDTSYSMAYLVPYSKTVVKDCTFSADFLVSPSGSATFTVEFINCKYEDGTAITSGIMDTAPNNRNATWIIDGVTYSY